MSDGPTRTQTDQLITVFFFCGLYRSAYRGLRFEKLRLRMVTADLVVWNKKNKIGRNGLIGVTQYAEQVRFL